MEAQVEAGDDGELVRGERTEPVEVGQFAAVRVRVHRHQRVRLQKHGPFAIAFGPSVAVAESANPAHVVQGGPDARQLPVDDGEQRAGVRSVGGEEQVGGLEVAVKDAHRSVRRQRFEQPLAALRRPRQTLRLRGPFQESIPPFDILAERHRLAQVRNRLRVQPVNSRESPHGLLPHVQQPLLRQRRGPLARPQAQHVAFKPRHHEVGAAEPLRIIVRPAHRAMRHIGAVQRVQHFHLAQHIRGATPIDVGRRQADEPRFHIPARRHAEAVGEAGVPRHRMHVEDARAASVLRFAEPIEPLLEFRYTHGAPPLVVPSRIDPADHDGIMVRLRRKK